MPRDRCWHPRLRCSKATRSPQIKMTISANQVENWHWCGRTWAEATSSKEGWDIGGTGWLEVQEKPWCAKGGVEKWWFGNRGSVFDSAAARPCVSWGESRCHRCLICHLCLSICIECSWRTELFFFFFSFLLCAALISRKPRGNKRILGERPRCKNKCIPCKRQASHRNAIWQPAQTCHWIFSDLLGSINIILESSLIVAYRHLLGLQILPS